MILAYINGVARETHQHPDSMTTTTTVDLVTRPIADSDTIGTAWSDNVEYNGLNVHKMFYMNDTLDAQIAKVMSEWEADYQECYLGYCPSKDQFVMGFDMWREHRHGDFESGYGYIIFDLYTKETNVCNDEVRMRNKMRCYGNGIFYSNGHAGVKDEFPGIVDVRLD